MKNYSKVGKKQGKPEFRIPSGYKVQKSLYDKIKKVHRAPKMNKGRER